MGFSQSDYDLKNTFKFEKFLLSLSGFYPRRTNNYWYFYVLSALGNLFVGYGQLFSMVVQMVIDRHDLSKLTEMLLFFMTHFTYLCKLSNFGFYKNHLFEIENTLTDPAFYGFSRQQLKYLKEKIALCDLIARIFRILCVMVVIFYALVPHLDESEKKNLPLPGWLPYDVTRYYFISSVFQILSIGSSAYNNSSIDILTWKFISLASAQFDILKDNIKNTNYKTQKNISRAAIKQQLKTYIIHHTKTINLVYKIEYMFSKGIFLQFAASVVVICFTGFQMIVVPIPSLQFVLLFTYFACMMCQVAMYCWYGHDVMTTSSEIGQFFYMSNWYESDLEIRKTMLIFLERAKRPIVLTAGNFVTLSLMTLTGILKSSYSYFAVLQRLYKDK